MTTTASTSTPDLSKPATGWSRISSRIYDPILGLGERRGQSARRRDVLSRARGVTLEIGSGTGLNLGHYPSSLDRLVLAEPDEAMRARLQRRAERSGRPVSVIEAAAESLPFADGSVDTVVSTLVLCTVESPQVALREIARVLAPEGQLLFIEHVRADSPRRARWQDRLEAPWAAFACGCRCNRPTLTLMAECGFELDVSEASWRGMPSIVKPLAYGRATPTGIARG